MQKTKKNKKSSNSSDISGFHKQSLEGCHNRKMTQFRDQTTMLNNYQKELINIREKLKTSSRENENIYELMKREKELQKLIENIEDNNEELDYLINASDILYNYYETTEKSIEKTQKNVVDLSFLFKNNNNKILFKNSPKLEEGDSENTNIGDRGDLLNEYLTEIDPNYTSPIREIIGCSKCGKDDTIEYTIDGLLCCIGCDTVQIIFTDNDKPSYKEPPKEISYFSYNRMNHFIEWINQIQGKETTDIPDKVFNIIYLELKKYKIKNLATIKSEMIKDILKKNKMNKYYEHIPYIVSRITGKPNPHFTLELEEKLKNMFRDIQAPFARHLPEDRKNFLSYSFVLYKLLELLGEYEFLEHFQLLKSREKLYNQEVIWKKICNDLEWDFYSSV